MRGTLPRLSTTLAAIAGHFRAAPMRSWGTDCESERHSRARRDAAWRAWGRALLRGGEHADARDQGETIASARPEWTRKRAHTANRASLVQGQAPRPALGSAPYGAGVPQHQLGIVSNFRVASRKPSRPAGAGTQRRGPARMSAPSPFVPRGCPESRRCPLTLALGATDRGRDAASVGQSRRFVRAHLRVVRPADAPTARRSNRPRRSAARFQRDEVAGCARRVGCAPARGASSPLGCRCQHRHAAAFAHSTTRRADLRSCAQGRCRRGHRWMRRGD